MISGKASSGKPYAGNPHVWSRVKSEHVEQSAGIAFGVRMLLAGLFAVSVPVIGQGANVWYVDANNGNDLWDGKSAVMDVDAGSGPKKTLAAIASCTKAYDTVYAAPGYYSNDAVTVKGRLYRACVTNYASLVATSSAKDTFIVGAATTDVTQGDQYGNGPDAISGVYLYKNSTLQGFTVTGGRTHTNADDSANDVGGGVCGISSAFVKECVISNNACSYRGGGVSGERNGSNVAKGPSVYRCLFAKNVADTSLAHSALNLNAVDNCIFSSSTSGYQAYQCYSMRNCTFVGTGSHIRDSRAWNCLMLHSDGGKNYLTNCFYVGALSTGSTCDTSSRQITADQAALDSGTWIPAKTSIVVDAGNAAYYTNSERLDVYGGQRVYNGKIDVGAVEYDWRGDFGEMLNPKGRADVVSAGENVTTNIVSGILVPAGESVEVDYSLRRDTACHFTAVPAAGGSVDARSGDAVLLPDSAGRYTYRGNAGKNRVSISYSGVGEASVTDFFDDGAGFCLTVK